MNITCAKCLVLNIFCTTWGETTWGETLMMSGISMEVHDVVQRLDDLNHDSSIALCSWSKI